MCNILVATTRILQSGCSQLAQRCDDRNHLATRLGKMAFTKFAQMAGTAGRNVWMLATGGGQILRLQATFKVEKAIHQAVKAH